MIWKISSKTRRQPEKCGAGPWRTHRSSWRITPLHPLSAGPSSTKEYKAGDTVESGKTLCTIYDLSYLEMTLNIDELDISTVEAGQTVQITAEAVEGKTFTGVVTKVSVAGTTSGGITSYRSPSVSTRPTACYRA